MPHFRRELQQPQHSAANFRAPTLHALAAPHALITGMRMRVFLSSRP